MPLICGSAGLVVSVVSPSVGAAGPMSSSVTTKAVEASETLAATSLSVAVRLLAPSPSGTVAVIDQAPVPSAVPVPISVVPS